MRRILIAAYSDNPANWIGQRMTLYCDPDVTWAGVKVGGIRISHLSGLDGPKTFLLTQTRGKKAEVVIHPLAADAESDDVFITRMMAEIETAETLEVLKAIGFLLKKKSKVVQEALRPLYKHRQTELETGQL